MFCEKCGTQLRDEAKFCQKCGTTVKMRNIDQNQAVATAGDGLSQTPQIVKPVAPGAGYQPVYQVQPRLYYPPGTHPYHSLGGFLMFFVVMNYIGGAIGILSTIFTMYAYISVADIFFKAERYMNGISAFWFCSFFGSIILMLLSTTYMFSFASKIRNKDDGFLGYAQTRSVALLITSGCFYLTEFVWLKSYPAVAAVNFSKSMWQILMWAGVWIFSLIFCSAYFGSSVRVRTYMGSDTYLRKSMMNKTTVSPIPADGSHLFPGKLNKNDSNSSGKEHKWACSGCGNMVSSDTCPYCGKRFEVAWTCPECGETNTAFAKKCVSCGKMWSSIKETEEKPKQNYWTCPTCLRKNSMDFKVCECGTPKENAIKHTPITDESTEADAWVCPACGNVNAEYVGTCGCGQSKF